MWNTHWNMALWHDMLTSSHFQSAALLLKLWFYNQSHSIWQNHHAHKLKTLAMMWLVIFTCKMITQRENYKLIHVCVTCCMVSWKRPIERCVCGEKAWPPSRGNTDNSYYLANVCPESNQIYCPMLLWRKLTKVCEKSVNVVTKVLSLQHCL